MSAEGPPASTIVLILGPLLLLVAYGAAALWFARRVAFPPRLAGEVVPVELPTPGHHAALVHLPPETRRFAEPVIVCHGLAANRFSVDLTDDGRGSDRFSLPRALSRAGFDVWLLELRGRGDARVPRGADWSFDDEVRGEVPAAIETVRALTGAAEVLWVGHSKGGLLMYCAQALALPETRHVRALVAIGSPGCFQPQRRRFGPVVLLGMVFAGLRLRVPLRALSLLGVPLSALLLFLRALAFGPLSIERRTFRSVLATAISDIAPGVMRQFAGWILGDGRVVSSDGTAYEEGFPRLRLPVLFVAGGGDTVAPVETLRFVHDRVGSSDRTFWVAGRAEGYAVDYAHADLVMGRHAPEELFPRITAWLAARARPATPSEGP